MFCPSTPAESWGGGDEEGQLTGRGWGPLSIVCHPCRAVGREAPRVSRWCLRQGEEWTLCPGSSGHSEEGCGEVDRGGENVSPSPSDLEFLTVFLMHRVW